MPSSERPTGFEAYNSEEFQAFCKKFGIQTGLLTKQLTITFTESALIVDQQYIADPGVL